MKVLIFSDLHIDDYQRFSIDGSRLYNTVNVVKDVFEIAHKNNINTIIFAGDLFDKPKVIKTFPFVLTVGIFKEMFEKYPNIKVLAIDGNHDLSSKNLSDNDLSITPLFALDMVFKNFVLVNNAVIRIEGNDFVFIPYYNYSDDFFTQLTKMDYNGKKNYLVIHQTPKHSNKMIPFDFDAEVFEDTFDYVFCGHIHKQEQVTPNFLIIGSPLHKDISDFGLDKGVIIFDTDTNKWENVYLDYPKFQYSTDYEKETVVDNVFIMPKIEKKVSTKSKVLGYNMQHDELIKVYIEKVLELPLEYYEIAKTLI